MFRSGRGGKESRESISKLKALQDTVLRMNEKNVRLQAENKGLKQDLEKSLQEHAESKDKHRKWDTFPCVYLIVSIVVEDY